MTSVDEGENIDSLLAQYGGGDSIDDDVIDAADASNAMLEPNEIPSYGEAAVDDEAPVSDDRLEETMRMYDNHGPQAGRTPTILLFGITSMIFFVIAIIFLATYPLAGVSFLALLLPSVILTLYTRGHPALGPNPLFLLKLYMLSASVLCALAIASELLYMLVISVFDVHIDNSFTFVLSSGSQSVPYDMTFFGALMFAVTYGIYFAASEEGLKWFLIKAASHQSRRETSLMFNAAALGVGFGLGREILLTAWMIWQEASSDEILQSMLLGILRQALQVLTANLTTVVFLRDNMPGAYSCHAITSAFHATGVRVACFVILFLCDVLDMNCTLCWGLLLYFVAFLASYKLYQRERGRLPHDIDQYLIGTINHDFVPV